MSSKKEPKLEVRSVTYLCDSEASFHWLETLINIVERGIGTSPEKQDKQS